ncbi:AAEL012398-PA [Aedes aegypti]|uniref:AAEL012398-PA n=1 Tax=Aedes aegypti TaxID=7159 RepID=Q16M82_AEDAE|nr:AAEL012398-PA [Aedes aegypti]
MLVVAAPSTQSWELFNTVQCGETTCSITTQDCIVDRCECKPNLEQREDGSCHICPMEGQSCTGCCFGDAICYGGRCQRCYMDQNGECIAQTSLFFLTAAQVALATAMVIGVSALATLMYKTFRARSRNNSQRPLGNNLNRTGSSRISLSSIQIRVLRRLRDRPPKYETRHNYDFHQREQAAPRDDGPRTNTTPVNQPGGRSDPIIGAPPPAYDGDVASLVDFPPPYSAEPSHPSARVAIIDARRNGDSADSGVTTGHDAGVVNGAFESDGKIEGSADINLVDNGKDKTIHI